MPHDARSARPGASEPSDALGELAAAVPRPRAADQVFEALAAAILRGQLPPDQPLPAERALTEKFGVSRVLIRQAVHRLEELGLVRVRQGGQTVVLDPRRASDPRVLALSIELAIADVSVLRDVAERQLLSGVILLEAAETRLDAAQLDALDAILAEYEAAGEAGGVDFVTRFWTRITEATQNRVFMHEARYWFEIMERRFGAARPLMWDHATRLEVHREVLRLLRARAGAADYYLKKVRATLRG